MLPRHEVWENQGSRKECTIDYICSHPDLKHRNDIKANDYIDNWQNQFDLLCAPGWKIGMIGSAYFLGLVIGLPIIGPYSDIYGRRNTFLMTVSVLSLI